MINKFQQGGQMIQQFAQELIQNNVMTEEQLTQLAQQNPQVIQQLFQIWQQNGIEGVVQALQQQAQSARNGAKLNYLKRLTGICPEGSKLVYFKRGGRICSKCEKEVKKDCGGTKFVEKGAKVCPKCGKIHSGKCGVKMAQQGESSKEFLTDYSKPKEKFTAKLDGKKVKIKVNAGQKAGEDPITYKGLNYYLSGDSTLHKAEKQGKSFKELRRNK